MSHRPFAIAAALALVTTLTATATPVIAAPRQIDVRLIAKPEFSPEGIHIRTAQGQHSMYAVHAKVAVFKAFERAKAGQCLRLQVTADFDFSDASGIERASVGCP